LRNSAPATNADKIKFDFILFFFLRLVLVMNVLRAQTYNKSNVE